MRGKIFIWIMIILSIIAMVLAIIDKNLVAGLCDFILIGLWCWNYYDLKTEEK